MRKFRVIGPLVALGCSLALVGCAPEAPSTPEPTETETPTEAPAADPEFVPGGTATENEPFFGWLLKGLKDEGPINGVNTVNAVAAGGFDKQAMTVSFDASKTGLEADNIFVSVRVADECLIGQVVTSSGEAVTQVMAPVGPEPGVCLIGETRPIDW